MERLYRLVHKWRELALTLDEWGDSRGAQVLKRVALDLETDLQSAEDTLLTPAEAALRVGRHRETLERAIRTGRLPNSANGADPESDWPTY
jgi:hypothetical protein